MAPSTPTTAPNVTPIRSRLEDDNTWTLHVGNGDALVLGAQIAHGANRYSESSPLFSTPSLSH
eukprot:scaffold26369_cov39-Attheya_sp.AAC.2